MAQQRLLCIEPDAAAVDEIRRAFEPYGLRVESIPNGEQAVEWARTNNPALIILSVEPRKVGYAICNKLKRSPTLRGIPLVLISAEETLATFEQHKKLKSRAEEYLLKPLDMTDLLAKANRRLGLGDTQAEARAMPDGDSGEIEISDEEIAEVSLDEADALLQLDGDEPTDSISAGVLANGAGSGKIPLGSVSLGLLGDLSKPNVVGDLSGPFQSRPHHAPAAAAFDAEQFDLETQAAFAALEAGATEGGMSAQAGQSTRVGLGAPETSEITVTMEAEDGADSQGEIVDLQSLWSEEELPGKLPWEDSAVPDPSGIPVRTPEITDHDLRILGSSEEDPTAGQVTPPPDGVASIEDILLSGLESEVPPLPEEVLYDDRPHADLQVQLEAAREEKQASESRVAALQARIASLETERQTVRKEQDEQRERMTHAANQGAFSKERDLLSLREIINKKEKDILDLRDALDAKERQILDHKDKIRENERARRDLEERTLGFEKNNVAANEKLAELAQDKEKSVEREKGLKARLDDAHEELRKGQDETDALRKRIAHEIERGRVEVEKTRIELEGKLAEEEQSHRETLSKATDEWAATEAAEKAEYKADLARQEGSHRVEVEGLHRRLGEEAAMAAERLQNELVKLRRDHEKAMASLKEEQTLQLASERQAYETETEAKHRANRDEVLGLRRRHEEELTAAEDRRQRDILEQEQRRVVELEQAENRRRAEMQARDEEHHLRVTELERRHLIENTELGERHRIEYDQAVGRAFRAEGELVARAQEIDQAYRRLAGLEADLDAARAELGDRDVKLGLMRDRLGEVETKLADYEDQIVRAFQRLRADEKTTEKVRRALAVGLALLDERAAAPSAPVPMKPAAPSEEAEKS